MTSSSSKSEAENYGFARVRDAAFDAVNSLWHRRQSEGVSQKDVADRIGKDPAWISRQLKGPGNWTFRTFGAFVEALNGEAEIQVFAIEDPLTTAPNFDAYNRSDNVNAKSSTLGNESVESAKSYGAQSSVRSHAPNPFINLSEEEKYQSLEMA